MSLTFFFLLAGAAILILLLIVVGIVLMNRPTAVPQEPPLPALDLNSLAVDETIPTSPRFEIYNIPMRLAAVVVAPAGRTTELPELAGLADLLDDVTPGMTAAFHQHQPQLVVWPAQLSSEGFVRSFFRHVALPGNKGRGTPWCSLAGRIPSAHDSVLVGLVCRSATANSLGQIPVDRPTKWLDVIRIRDPD